MRHLSIINTALESDSVIPELPVAPDNTSEQSIQMNVAEEIAEIKSDINALETSVEKVEASLEQLSFYRDVLESSKSGVDQESCKLISYGLHNAVRNVGLSLRSKGVDLESFADVVDTIPVVRDLRSIEEATDDFIDDVANGNITNISAEDDHSDADINAGIDDDTKPAEGEGDSEATTDGLGETKPEEDDVAPAADDTPAAATDDVPSAEEGEPAPVDEPPPAAEPHQPVEEPLALQGDNEQSPTINMVMREGEVQISIESIDNLHVRLGATLESLVVDIYRGITEFFSKLFHGYESAGRVAQTLLPQLETLIEQVKGKDIEVPWGFAGVDRLAYKGKVDPKSILEGQVALQNAFNTLVNKLPKLTQDVTGKINKAIDSVITLDETDVKKTEVDLKLAEQIYKDYKQQLVDVYPKDLPGGLQVEFGDYGFGWSEVKSYVKSSREPIRVSDLTVLVDLLTNVIAMSKLFSARKGILESINKQQAINEAFAKRSVHSTWLIGLKSQLNSIEQAHAKNIVQYFETVYKHSMSVVSFVESVVEGLRDAVNGSDE